MSERCTLFLNYSHDDTNWLTAISEQLKVLESEGLVTICEDRMLPVGELWLEQLHAMMLSAHLGLLLVSATFLSSPYVREQGVPRLIGRHEQGGMRIYPLLLQPCPFEMLSWLRRRERIRFECDKLGDVLGWKENPK